MYVLVYVYVYTLIDRNRFCINKVSYRIIGLHQNMGTWRHTKQFLFKVKKYKKTSRATSTLGNSVLLESMLITRTLYCLVCFIFQDRACEKGTHAKSL